MPCCWNLTIRSLLALLLGAGAPREGSGSGRCGDGRIHRRSGHGRAAPARPAAPPAPTLQPAAAARRRAGGCCAGAGAACGCRGTRGACRACCGPSRGGRRLWCRRGGGGGSSSRGWGGRGGGGAGGGGAPAAAAGRRLGVIDPARGLAAPTHRRCAPAGCFSFFLLAMQQCCGQLVALGVLFWPREAFSCWRWHFGTGAGWGECSTIGGKLGAGRVVELRSGTFRSGSRRPPLLYLDLPGASLLPPCLQRRRCPPAACPSCSYMEWALACCPTCTL